MISSKPMKYELVFCGNSSYEGFVSAVRNKISIDRVCFIGIENLRMFLGVKRGFSKVECFKKEEYSWCRVSRDIRACTLNVDRMLDSKEEFEAELVSVFFDMFPRAEESYYDTLPAYEDIMTAITRWPVQKALDALHYNYYVDARSTVDDADGIITITCDSGVVCVPFTRDSTECRLQVERALYHPDSKVSSVFNRFFDGCQSLWSRITSVPIVSVLNRLDEIVR